MKQLRITINDIAKGLGASKVIPLKYAMRCWSCDEILDKRTDICSKCDTCWKCAGGKRHGHTRIPTLKEIRKWNKEFMKRHNIK